MVPEPEKKQRLVLIDGHSLVYRAFFALPSLTDRDGKMVTGDRDALQLANDDVFVLTSKRGVSETILYTPDRVRERYGLEPIQTVDLKGLVGDVSDNIPGIRGIGEKTAIKLIQEFGSVESLVENRARVTPPKVQKLLDEHWEQALLSKKMATILLDVDAKLDLSHGSAKDYRPDAARTILADHGFRSLAARVPTTWSDGSAMSAPPIFAPPAREQGRLPLDGEPVRPPAQSTLALESPPAEVVTVVREKPELDRLVAAFAAAERAG